MSTSPLHIGPICDAALSIVSSYRDSSLQKKIDGTIVGKSNRKKGIPNYSQFGEWVKKHTI